MAALAGGILRQGDASRLVRGVGTDSRHLGTGELFLALRGDRFDGHDFLKVAELAGAAGAIVAAGTARPEFSPTFALIEVADTLKGYQRLAREYRRRLPMRVVAITGSNGKTSTKDFTAAVLSTRYRVLKTEGNFNNHIGVPRMILRATAEEDVAVLEMGMNHPGEIRPLAQIAAPRVAIITNIGTAHIEYMGSREAIAQEKGTLAEEIPADGWVILPAHDPFTKSITARTSAEVLTVGIDSGDLRATQVEQTAIGNRFTVVLGDQSAPASINVIGHHMVANALLAVGAGIALGMDLAEAVHGLSAAQLTEGRVQPRTAGGLHFIDDSYNANPDSMVVALATLATSQVRGRRIAVLGRMGELGVHAASGHRRVGEAAGEQRIDCVVAVGEEAAGIAEGAEESGAKEVRRVRDVQEATDLLRQIASSDDLILIKGSRSAGMERIIAAVAGGGGVLSPGAPLPLSHS